MLGLSWVNVNVHNLDITLCGEKVIHWDSETYLGVSLNSNITDRAITQTVCSFYQKSNYVIDIFHRPCLCYQL